MAVVYHPLWQEIIQSYFKKNGFVIVKKAISEDLANFCFEYLKIKSNAPAQPKYKADQ